MYRDTTVGRRWVKRRSQTPCQIRHFEGQEPVNPSIQAHSCWGGYNEDGDYIRAVMGITLVHRSMLRRYHPVRHVVTLEHKCARVAREQDGTTLWSNERKKDYSLQRTKSSSCTG